MTERRGNRDFDTFVARFQAVPFARSVCLVGADDLEVLVDEDVVGPVDADVVDLVLAVAQLHNTIDDAPRVGRQCGFCGLIRRGSADDGAGRLVVARRDLTNLL